MKQNGSAFDLLFRDGRNVMGLPLEERKALLADLLAPLKGQLVIVGDFPAEAMLFDQLVLGAKLEDVRSRTSETDSKG